MNESIKNNAAFIIDQIQKISNDKPGKKQLQKIVYLIEQKGIDLKYEYGLHFYGPYSAVLNTETISLSMDGIIEFDYSGNSHKMSIKNGFSITTDLSDVQEEQIKQIIKAFKDRSPSELELLSTAIYAYNNLDNKTKGNVIKGVKKIKGTKYNISEIEEALEDFAYFEKTLKEP